jgi:hypothetical protein
MHCLLNCFDRRCIWHLQVRQEINNHWQNRILLVWVLDIWYSKVEQKPIWMRLPWNEDNWDDLTSFFHLDFDFMGWLITYKGQIQTL